MAWVSPSPNLRTLTEATLYPGVAVIESANISVGRGTGTPFELVGAPWISTAGARELAVYLNARQISGVRFIPTSFIPTSSQFAGERCDGVNILLLDRETLDAPEVGLELAAALYQLYPDKFQLDKIQPLLANAIAYQALQAGRDPRRIAEDGRDAVEAFMLLRQKYLLYK